ncbi:MAG: SDR family NAD(P)-dependent oxidoreductase [Parvibaculales bacterium]
MDAANLKGKIALITGGGAGIGRAIAEAFALHGAKTIIADKDKNRCESIESDFKQKGYEVMVAHTDVTVSEQVQEMMSNIDQHFGQLNILVNNVGDFLELIKPFKEFTDDEIDALFNANLNSMFKVTRAAIPLMEKAGAGGSIINISSIEAFRGIPTAVVYSAFKHAITGFTRSLALDLGPHGVRVNAIAPETTETEQVSPVAMTPEQHKDHIPRWNPSGRFGKPSDAAGCALFLASDMSAWVNGTTINLDGGALAAAGWYRTPSNQWTVAPIVTGDGFGYS